MQKEFWLQRWENNEIGFHNNEVNPLLVTYLPTLNLPAEASRLLLPLCGKSRDIAWLLLQGIEVVGIELSELAVTQLFSELQLKPKVRELPKVKVFSAENLTLMVADIFDITQAQVGRVDAVYDRAALVALPSDMRKKYSEQLMTLTGAAPQLLISFDYPQAALPGPPFSVPASELQDLYGQHYQLTLLASAAIAGGLKGKCEAQEQVWYLNPE